jgi:hypothetical protein
VTGPRHRRHCRPMRAAPDPWCVGFDEHLRRPGIQRTPPSPTITTVIARRTPMTASAPATSPRIRPCRHHDRAVGVIDMDPFHNCARQTARPLPYLGVQHPVCLPDRFEPSTARNLGIRRGASADSPSTHPRTQHKSVICEELPYGPRHSPADMPESRTGRPPSQSSEFRLRQFT